MRYFFIAMTNKLNAKTKKIWFGNGVPAELKHIFYQIVSFNYRNAKNLLLS